MPRRHLLLVSLAALACEAPPSAEPAAQLPDELEARVEARLDALSAKTGIYAKHLPSGRELSIRADEPMNTLSVIKIPIMVEAFAAHAAGRIDLDARHTIQRGELRRGSGLLQTFEPGMAPTYRDLTRQMIITSDNTATDIMMDVVGHEQVNRLIAALGHEETALRMSTGDLFREVWVRADPAHARLSHPEVYERGFPSDEGASDRTFAFEGDSTVWLGRTTAREMGRLLEQLYDGDLADEEATDEMIGMLMGQFYTTRLPRRVRFQGVSVAHKTGDWPPIAGNDVGILYYDGGPTIISVFTNQNTGDFYELEETLGFIAEDIVNAWR